MYWKNLHGGVCHCFPCFSFSHDFEFIESPQHNEELDSSFLLQVTEERLTYKTLPKDLPLQILLWPEARHMIYTCHGVF